MPTTTVELEVADDGFSFTLDDPVKGKLDNTTYKLAMGWVDVSEYVFRVSINRGRNRDLDRFSAGLLNVALRNGERTFDPLHTGSPFYGDILPRRQIRVFTDEIQQYQGFIEFWDFSYDVSGESIATVSAADGFTLLAQQELVDQPVVMEASGSRIGNILNNSNVGWSTIERDIDTGSSTLPAGTATGNALQYLQQVELSEQGYLFMGKSGKVTFTGRNYFKDPSNALSFSDDGSGISFIEANVNYGTDLMLNQANVTWSGGTAISGNSSSQSAYGVLSRDFDTLLSTSTQAQDYANFVVGKYGEPEYRFNDFTVVLDGVSDSQVADVLLLELGDFVSITFTPNGVGSPIVRLGEVTKINHSINVDLHYMTIGVTSVEFVGFILDNIEFGILDSGLLAF